MMDTKPAVIVFDSSELIRRGICDVLAKRPDLTIVGQVDRLDELATQGRIGKVSNQHLAYAGNQWDLSEIRMDGGPAGAAFLREQGVDVVLLTPV